MTSTYEWSTVAICLSSTGKPQQPNTNKSSPKPTCWLRLAVDPVTEVALSFRVEAFHADCVIRAGLQTLQHVVADTGIRERLGLVVSAAFKLLVEYDEPFNWTRRLSFVLGREIIETRK